MALLVKAGCVNIEAVTKQSAVLLFLHGLGDTGHGWGSILSDIRPPYVRVICPTASVMPVTLNNGFKMPSWFDIYSLSRGKAEDESGIRKAVKEVHETITELETNGTPASRIVLGGFSQGGSLAAFSALTYKKPLAGLLCLSCWIPLGEKLSKVDKSLEPEALEPNKDVCVLQCHGDSDPVVEYRYGQLSAELLKSIGCKKHEFRTFSGLGHSSCPEELDAVREWLAGCLLPQGGSI